MLRHRTPSTDCSIWLPPAHNGRLGPPFAFISPCLLPQGHRTLHAIVTDLEDRGLLDSTLILMMGEFGRSPVINKNAGRDHWPRVMSMVMAGGGMRHGQVIGSTDKQGGDIDTRRVAPGDLAATVFHHLGIAPNTNWIDPQGRPRPIVAEGGKVMGELV